MALGSPDLQITTVAIQNYTSDIVFIKYSGLPANQPSSYQNFVAIWEATSIPWSQDPIQKTPIPQNSQIGTVVISGLTITTSSYIVGYGVGPEIPSICACAPLNVGGLRAPPTSVQIAPIGVGPNSVAVQYRTLGGYLPATYDNWIGLWRGYVSPYNSPKPLGTVRIPTDSTEGSVAINGVDIGINLPYTLIYFMGGSDRPQGNTQAAAILTFDSSGG